MSKKQQRREGGRVKGREGGERERDKRCHRPCSYLLQVIRSPSILLFSTVAYRRSEEEVAVPVKKHTGREPILLLSKAYNFELSWSVNYVGSGFVNRNHEVGGGGYALSGERDVSTTVFYYSQITAMVVQLHTCTFGYPLSPHPHFSTSTLLNVCM